MTAIAILTNARAADQRSMIAHRLTTVQRYDRIVVLEQGRVAGVGSWDALMAGNGAFRAMARVA